MFCTFRTAIQVPIGHVMNLAGMLGSNKDAAVTAVLLPLLQMLAFDNQYHYCIWLGTSL